MDKVQKIRERVVEIVNSINPFIPDEDGKNSDYEAGKLDVATQILQIIDSLEEPASGLDNGDMPIERWKQAVKAASNQRNYRSSKGLTETRDDYFVDGVQWADEHPKEEPVSEDLEEAAVEWFNSVKYKSDLSGTPINAFKAGAGWQKEKDFQYVKKECERTGSCCDNDIAIEAAKRHPYYYISEMDAYANIGFKEGAMWQKEQMMAKAIDGEVGYWNLRGLSVNVELPHSVEEGDKVKVIVIKED